MKKKLLRSFQVLCGLLLSANLVNAQPLHQPIPAYTNDGSCARVGNASTFATGAFGGYMQLTMGGIEVTEDEHFLCQNVPHDDDRNIIVNKKSANNGATLGLNRFNISQLLGVGTSSDRVWDTEIDESLNRLYIIGESSAPYFSGYVLCVDLTTLAPVTSFGSMGVLSIASKQGKGTGITLTGVGNNFAVTVNAGSKIFVREYTFTGVPVISGTIDIPGFSSASSVASIKKAPNGNFYVGGKTNNGTDIPMLWSLKRQASGYFVQNSTSPVGSTIGTGIFMDFAFYVDPSPANPSNYAFDVVAVGNGGTGNGIYGKYVIPAVTSSFFTPLASFTNQGSVPGKSLATNNSATDIVFSRCTVNDDGYVSVLGYYYSSSANKLLMGYLRPDGTAYTTTYEAPFPSSSYPCERIHKSTGFAEDTDGNLLVSGCATGGTYTLIKLSNDYDCMPTLSLHGSSDLVCSGDQAYLSIGISAGHSYTVQTLGGLPFYTGNSSIALLVYPTVTTTYVVTATNPATGCQVIRQHTITVTANNPSFSMSLNTANPSYFTMSAIANDQSAGSVSGFGYAWVLEEIDGSGNSIFMFSNPSCWWQALSSPNVFNGVNCIANSYSGLSTISNCSSPSVGLFEYGKRYRVTRGTWNNNCSWNQASMIIEVVIKKGALAIEKHADDSAPDYRYMAQEEGVASVPSMEVYPNPNNGQFTVASADGFDSEIQVYDMTGKVVYEFARPIGTELSADLSQLNRGIYLIKTVVQGQLKTEKVIIE